MAAVLFRRSRRNVAMAAASGAAILLTVASVHAQDGGGSFFEQLFGVQRQAPARPAYNPYGQYGGYGYSERRQWRAERRARIKTRYAALPKAEKFDPDKITGKQPVDQKAILDNPTKAILEDKTLRPGDIVMLPGGPKVFTGGSEKRHRIGEFEDVKHSRMIDKKTRQKLLAMMVPVGAMPADQARKVMALKVKLAQPDEIAAVEARNEASEPAAPRQIMPWKTTR